MKVGVEFKIDVTKIDKSKLFEGKKGKYLSLKTFIDTEKEDQYKWQGIVNYSDYSKGDNTPALGNAKIFWIDGQASKPKTEAPKQQSDSFGSDFEDDAIPF